MELYQARYFINPNLMISGNLADAYSNESAEDEPHNLLQWGASVEWRKDGSPFGLFASYQGSLDSEIGGSTDNVTVHSAMAGLKIYFGSQTLREQADSGATLQDFNPYTGVNHVRFSDWE